MEVRNVTSLQASYLLSTRPDAAVVDVRTDLEWEEIGLPIISHNLILLSWPPQPNLLASHQFTETLISQVADLSRPVFFLCRSGIRSLAAANLAAGAGYVNSYNISDGFEGSISGPGWKGSNLPWQIT